MTLDIDDLIKRFPLEERIYRMRCVEAWSMVVPWIGFELGNCSSWLNQPVMPAASHFKTLYAPDQMPGQEDRFIGGGLYVHVEGLRLDEAMHPLAFMTLGVYGKALPPQKWCSAAAYHAVEIWLYKGIKSIVHIRLTHDEPPTTWNLSAPNEYGFMPM